MSTTNFLYPNSREVLSFYVVGHFYSKTMCKYICEQSVEKVAESIDVVVRWRGKKELELVSHIAKKLGFLSPSIKLPSPYQYGLDTDFSLC